MTLSDIVFIVAVTFCALMAGLLFSYSCSVNPSLKTLPDAGYLAAMQSINRAIQNPVFLIVFAGTLLLLPLHTYISYTKRSPAAFRMILTATVIYIVGTFCITAFGNIPLNNTLDKFDLATASAEAIRLQRMNFENKWNTLHLVRTVASIISLILLLAAATADKGFIRTGHER